MDSARSATGAFERLCTASVELLSVTGVGAMVMSGGQHRGTLFSSDSRAETIEDLQFTLGEGPCLHAYHERRPVLVGEVASSSVSSLLWPAFARAVSDAGVAAIFAFPLHAFGAGIGALDFYRDEPGPLDDDDVEGALVLANMAARQLLAAVAEQPPGWLPPPIERMMRERRRVHQATGMAAVQIRAGVEEALACLRAHAWARGRPLEEVSTEVVERRLRFDPYE